MPEVDDFNCGNPFGCIIYAYLLEFICFKLIFYAAVKVQSKDLRKF